VALAASTKALIGGLWCGFQDSATVGANLYKKIEVSGTPVEAAVEIFSPMNNLGGFSWIAGAQMQLNKTWTLNAKLNQKLQANFALKHQPHSAFIVQAGTLLRVDDPLGGGLPNVGFKITMKA